MFDETLMRIAHAVVEANRSGDLDALLNEHYAPHAVSIEAADGEGMPRAAEGLDAIRAKHAWWNSTMEMHGSEAFGPFFFDPDRFAARFTMDVTNRETGERIQGEEIAIYTVADGKIVKEEFFWAMG